MSKDPTRTEFPAGDFISENAVRAMFERRRSGSSSTPANAGGQARAAGPRPLRRWSVAELIARSMAPPPSTT